MKQRAMILSVCLLVTSCLLSGCSDKKYGDVEDATNRFAGAVNEYATALDSADSAEAVAKAMDRFADKMEKLVPTMKKLSKKYPELEGASEAPPELAEVQTTMEEAGKKMVGSMMKIMPHMQDPEVQKAQQRLDKVMADFSDQ